MSTHGGESMAKGADVAPARASAPQGLASVVDTFRTIYHRFRKFWPEVTAFVLMMVYTAFRTVAVATGIDTVAQTDWRVFLVLEIVTTVPYVWGIGDLVRGAMTGSHSRTRGTVAMVCVLVGVAGPYVYIALYGGLRHIQSGLITLVMVVIAVIGLRKSLARLAKTSRERRAREAAAAAGEPAEE
ncbi:MAG: hypothetical protein Q4G45_03785 [Actinomycetia bacterium]|nr:hypothetical protein [Actinomycetes bacterium]